MKLLDLVIQPSINNLAFLGGGSPADQLCVKFIQFGKVIKESFGDFFLHNIINVPQCSPDQKVLIFYFLVSGILKMLHINIKIDKTHYRYYMHHDCSKKS